MKKLITICVAILAGCGGGHGPKATPPPLSIIVSISPASASLNGGGIQTFTAKLLNDSSNAGVTWSVGGILGGNSTLGTISTAGLYAAPIAISAASSQIIKATSSADRTKSALALVTLTPPPTITSVTASCTPNSVEVGQTSQCIAKFAGTGSYSSAVNWSASSGAIDPSGLFTASTIGIANIVATSTQDATKFGITAVPATTAMAAITFQDLFDYADGTTIGSQTAPTGQQWLITGYSMETAQVWSDHLVHYPQGGVATGPWYVFVNTGSAVHSYSATFTVTANGGAGDCDVAAMIIYGNPNNILDKMIHTELHCNRITLTWWNGSSQQNYPVYTSSPGGSWVSGMTMTAGTTYTVTLSWDGGEWVYFTGPDGEIISFRDPNFTSVGGPGIVWEEASDPTDSLYTELSNVTTTN